ncbi:MAG: PDZ domain-containing protein, partial [Myxococcaceae bacterium]
NSRVEDADDFRERLRGYPAASSFTVKVFRDGDLKDLNITAVEFPPKLVDALAWDRLGIKVKETGGALQIASVHPGSPAERVGLSVGDFVLKLNNQPMKSISAFREALLAGRTARSVLLVIQRGRFGYYVTLPF